MNIQNQTPVRPETTVLTGASLDTTDLHRTIDFFLASVFAILFSPLMLLRAGWGLLQTRQLFPCQTRIGAGGKTFRLLTFSGSGPGTHSALLLNVLRGDLNLTGPRALEPDEAERLDASQSRRLDYRPGIFSAHALRQRVGIAYEDEWMVERNFLEQWSIKSHLGLIARSFIARLFGDNRTRHTPEQLDFFDIPIDNTTMEEAVNWLHARASGDQATNVSFVNADCLNKAYSDSTYHQALNECHRVLPDGIGIHVGSRMLGLSLRENINGTDLFPRLCEQLASSATPIYLLGARPGITQLVAEKMCKRHPGLRIAGMHHGYFSPAEEPDLIASINRSGAKVLLVAFGAPAQELWIREYSSALKPAVRLGVGGLFDFYSDRIPRAPQWLRELGLEWSWRLLQEPGRMWRRYLVGNPRFLFRVWKQKVFGTRTAHSPLPGFDTSRNELLKYYRQIGIYALRQRISFHLTRASWAGPVYGTLITKRLLDITVSATALALLSPLLLCTAVAIQLESPGSVLFSQIRVGRRGKTFRLWKFRSMYTDAESCKQALGGANEMQGGVLFKMKNDPRITRIGRFIRRYSIDEIPQLWNVLIGEMSLVGPRPALPDEVSQYTLEDRARLEATPGITCIWQVSGRSNLPFPEQVRLDVEYIYNQSPLQDFKLLLKTIPAIFQGQGAY